jgi:hypothetical protein
MTLYAVKPPDKERVKPGLRARTIRKPESISSVVVDHARGLQLVTRKLRLGQVEAFNGMLGVINSTTSSQTPPPPYFHKDM